MLLGPFLLVGLGLLLVRFSVELRLISKGLDIKPRIQLGIGRFLITIPQSLVAKMSLMIQDRNFGSMEKALRGLRTGLRVLDSFLQKIDLFHLEVLIGVGDPYWTALGCGGIWALLGPFLTGLSADNRFRTTPKVVVQPDFGEPGLQVDLHCIFQFRLGQIIINELKRVIV